jgi:hypothetical protein
MTRSPGQWLLDAVSIVFAATPIGFALIRAITTGHDWRYLWVALSALLGAAVVMVVGRAYRGRLLANMSVSLVAFVLSTMLAMAAALSIGTRFGPGIVVVAASFGLCCAASCLLYLLARASE